MRIAALVGLAIVALAWSGCSADGADACGTLTSTGTSCTFDGECTGYDVCREGWCSTPEAMTGTDPQGLIQLGDQTFSYELAPTELARSRGLAGRPCMTPGWGLILEWRDAAERQIDMSRMLFDLDLLFLGPDDRPVAAVYGAEAGSQMLIDSSGPTQRVLELEAGALADPVGEVLREPVIVPIE